MSHQETRLRNTFFALAFLTSLLCATAVTGQTPSFTYQGRLTDGVNAANGNYDLQFALFDSSLGATPIATQTIPNVLVTAGIFTVVLDFGANAFPGAPRFLEISARLAGTASFTTLSPRQQITSTPYAIRSLNASTADAVTAGGTLTGNIVNATTQYNLGSSRVLGLGPNTGTNNLLVGLNAGNTLIDGRENTFVGSGAGQATSGGPLDCATCGPGGTPLYRGSHNTFVGYRAGNSNIASFNSFFGSSAGASSSSSVAGTNSFFGSFAGALNTASRNSFFGAFSGSNNTTGTNNSFFGVNTGINNVVGVGNSFFGASTGSANTGSFNSFFGVGAGNNNTTGTSNTIIGADADVGSNNLTNATAIGANAQVDQSNSLVLGSSSVKVGIGTSTPLAALDTRGTMLVSGNVGIGTSTPLAALDTRGTMLVSGNVGIGTTTPLAKLDVNGTAVVQGGATVTGTNGDGAVLTARRPTGDTYVIIDSTTVAQNSVLAFRKNNFNRWLMYADGSTESGGNSGSDFRLDAYNNAGGIANYLTVTRASGNVGIGIPNPSEKLSVNGRLRLEQIDSGLGAGTVHLCRNASNVIATCDSSSLRYKKGITPFRGGLELLRGLRPISFTWKMDGSRDLGLGAEDVAKVEPLLVTHNDKGEIEGVRYDRLNVVLINAIKEQQDQLARLQEQIAQLQRQQRLSTLQARLLTKQRRQIAGLQKLVRLSRRARIRK